MNSGHQAFMGEKTVRILAASQTLFASKPLLQDLPSDNKLETIVLPQLGGETASVMGAALS